MIRITKSIISIGNAKAIGFGWYRLRMATLMLFADLAGLTLAIVFGHLITSDPFNFLFFDPSQVEHILMLGVILLVFMTNRLYPGVGIDPAEEIKLVTQFTSSALVIAMMVTIVLHPALPIAIVTILCIWALSIVNVLLMRWSIRITTAQLEKWGEPVVVLARGAQAGEIVQYFADRRRLGFVPVLVATDLDGRATIKRSMPVVNINSLIKGPSTRSLRDVGTIIIDASFFGQNLTDNSYNRLSSMFRHIIFVSDMGWLEGASLTTHDFEGLVGIEARRNHLNPLISIIKRIMDVIGSVLAMLLFSPFLLLIAALIKLDSPGPIFYTQHRIGKNGEPIRVYKFRSMVMGAEQVLTDFLKSNTEAQCEWKETQKLRNDPRITRLGRFLRKFSIDEVPQLFNVFLGDMSLVGPRPIMVNQVRLYGENIATYRGVRPGMTGLWQVSGRNRTTFQERARFDVYYVRHWSVWLDIYILLRTVWVVISQDGAY